MEKLLLEDVILVNTVDLGGNDHHDYVVVFFDKKDQEIYSWHTTTDINVSWTIGCHYTIQCEYEAYNNITNVKLLKRLHEDPNYIFPRRRKAGKSEQESSTPDGYDIMLRRK